MQQPLPIKIACVGDSITYGYGIPERGRNSYPAQLQQMLNERATGEWKVENFGVPSTTLLSAPREAYRKTWEHLQSLYYAADIVLILLGSNDSDGKHRQLIREHFEHDYHELIELYRQAGKGGKPRIILLTPPKFYREGNDYMASPGPIIRNVISPLIRQIAKSEGLELIELEDVLGEEWDEELIPDKLHPSAAGATLMAERMIATLLPQGD